MVTNGVCDGEQNGRRDDSFIREVSVSEPSHPWITSWKIQIGEEIFLKWCWVINGDDDNDINSTRVRFNKEEDLFIDWM